jgi:hypothetical protein
MYQEDQPDRDPNQDSQRNRGQQPNLYLYRTPRLLFAMTHICNPLCDQHATLLAIFRRAHFWSLMDL